MVDNYRKETVNWKKKTRTPRKQLFIKKYVFNNSLSMIFLSKIFIIAAQTWQIISQLHLVSFECCLIMDGMFSGFTYFSEEEQKLFYTQRSCFASGRRNQFLDLYPGFVERKKAKAQPEKTSVQSCNLSVWEVFRKQEVKMHKSHVSMQLWSNL